MENMENNFIKGKGDFFTKEGINDYIEEKTTPENFVDKGTPFDETYDNLEKIFVAFQFEQDEENFSHLEQEFTRIVEGKLSNGDFIGIVNFAREMVGDFLNSKEIRKLDPAQPGNAILIAEAVNWAAKVLTDSFYMLKPAMIVASAKLGAQIGKEDDGGWPIYYLFNRDVGVASFHDPGCEVDGLLRNMGFTGEIKDWEFGWSGVVRQDLAFHLLSGKEKLFLQKMRYSTLPGENAAEKKKLFDDIEKKYSI